MRGGESRNRTDDTRIFSPLLYQLSYLAPGEREESSEAFKKVNTPGTLSPRAAVKRGEEGSFALTICPESRMKPGMTMCGSSLIDAGIGTIDAHLALEDSLLDRLPADGMALLFYVSHPALVFGKNQNPWKECDVRRLWESGVRLARRLTGGGAVYHDEGNLNYAVIMPRERYRRTEVEEVVRRAFGALSLSARHEGTSLLVDGRKVSGTAYGFLRRRAIHHGTILLRSDLDALQRACAPGLDCIRTHAIASTPARVANLTEFRPETTERDVREALREAFENRYGALRPSPAPDVDPGVRERYRSAAWTLGRTPRFEVDAPGLGALVVEGGRVAEVKGLGGGAEAAGGRRLAGVRFDRDAMIAALSAERDAQAPWIDFVAAMNFFSPVF
jgi:lipoate---protein ligase